MASPVRVQVSRKAGSRLPPNTVIVSRPSKWGNPFRVGAADPHSAVGMPMSPGRAVYLFRLELESGIGAPWVVMRHAIAELRGKNLACWCALPRNDEPDVCHAAVLLELANNA